MKPVDKIGTRSLKNAKFKFLGELNDLLPVGKRDKVISCQFKGNPTVKHLIEALGIPHTEIGEVFVEHREVELSQKLEDNNEVLVKPYKYRVSGNYIDYRFLDEIQSYRTEPTRLNAPCATVTFLFVQDD